MTIEELKAENARLKAEVERLRITEQNQTERIIRLEVCIPVLKQDRDGLLYEETEQVKRLKADVERLKAEPDALTAYLYADTLRRDDIKTLKAHIERLTNAGDVIVGWMDWFADSETINKARQKWHAAKEGKQP